MHDPNYVLCSPCDNIAKGLSLCTWSSWMGRPEVWIRAMAQRERTFSPWPLHHFPIETIIPRGFFFTILASDTLRVKQGKLRAPFLVAKWHGEAGKRVSLLCPKKHTISAAVWKKELCNAACDWTRKSNNWLELQRARCEAQPSPPSAFLPQSLRSGSPQITLVNCFTSCSWPVHPFSSYQLLNTQQWRTEK